MIVPVISKFDTGLVKKVKEGTVKCQIWSV